MLYLTMFVQTLCLIAFEIGMQKSKWYYYKLLVVLIVVLLHITTNVDTYYLIKYLLHNSTKQWLVSNIHHYQKPDLV